MIFNEESTIQGSGGNLFYKRYGHLILPGSTTAEEGQLILPWHFLMTGHDLVDDGPLSPWVNVTVEGAVAEVEETGDGDVDALVWWVLVGGWWVVGM